MAPTASARASGSAAVAAQRFVEQLGVVGEQVQRNWFGGEEGGQLQQLHRRWALGCEPFQGQRPGGVDPAVVARPRHRGRAESARRARNRRR